MPITAKPRIKDVRFDREHIRIFTSNKTTRAAVALDNPSEPIGSICICTNGHVYIKSALNAPTTNTDWVLISSSAAD